MQAQTLSNPAARNLNPSGSPTSIAEGLGLAHDAGNLLGALGLYCDLLDLPGVLRPEHLHYARELRLLSQRSGALINRLLEGDRAQIEPIVGPPPKRLCAATVVRAFTPLLRSLAAPEASVSMAIASDLPTLPFAAEVLERILVNLTRNSATALRARPPTDAAGEVSPGQIHIAVCGDATQLRLTVMDNGQGMSEEMAAAFVKPEPLAKGALNGLGHHVIYDLLQSTGGQLTITVVPKRGTTVQIDWQVRASKTDRRKNAAPRPMTGSKPGRTLKLMPNLSSEGSQRKGAKLSC
jgi:signal transduction histidine kinase